MDLIVALLGAAVVVGGLVLLIDRQRSDRVPAVGLVAGIIVGAVAALVFLVTQMDLVPDQFDVEAQLAVLVLTGGAIAALGWRRARSR